MTHLCYTLDEAGKRLDMSETVLVRLSQFFKVPENAYEAAGYLSFKGDLLFSDQDIAFFRQVKERLLAGESLNDVKSRIRPDAIAAPAPTAAESAGRWLGCCTKHGEFLSVGATAEGFWDSVPELS